MDIIKKKVFITGGAGFVGSHLSDKLLELGCEVTVYDNLKTGQDVFLKNAKENSKFNFVNGDICDLDALKTAMQGHDFVFHLSANADVRGGITNTRIDLEQNTIGTWNVLEAMRLNNVKGIAFSSTSAMYGEPTVYPTPEDYCPIQTSMYGASKLAGEAMIQAFCEAFEMKSWIFRFVSLIGERYTHGVVFDFVKKLKKNPKELEILGDGEQKKSYLYIGDCVNAMLTAIEKADEKVNIFNLGNVEYMNVKDVANIIIKEMGLTDVTFNFTGGAKGWIGDAPTVQLATDKIRGLNWKPEVTIEEGIAKTTKFLLENEFLLSARD
jgi:UDP-glucose 4-epimerase